MKLLLVCENGAGSRKRPALCCVVGRKPWGQKGGVVRLGNNRFSFGRVRRSPPLRFVTKITVFPHYLLNFNSTPRICVSFLETREESSPNTSKTLHQSVVYVFSISRRNSFTKFQPCHPINLHGVLCVF